MSFVLQRIDLKQRAIFAYLPEAWFEVRLEHFQLPLNESVLVTTKNSYKGFEDLVCSMLAGFKLEIIA